MQRDIYNDIASRTGGDIYIGVVGPVRTGKSTFIKKFMEKLVLPLVEDKNLKKRMTDELPQSADGKTIMTTEPKFVPETAVSLKLDNVTARIRLIDCVGYLVEDAIGHVEDGKPRMVKTPWTDVDIPFEEAGEIGTTKVIREHSTIGIVVTTDGTVTDLSRAAYIDAEEKVVSELKSIGKPFLIVLNSRTPNSVETVKLRDSLEEKYGVTVVACDVDSATSVDLEIILANLLLEFPVKRIDIVTPKWLRTLGVDNEVIATLTDRLLAIGEIKKLRDYKIVENVYADVDFIEGIPDINVDSSKGTVSVIVTPKSDLFYKALSSFSGTEVDDEYKLMSYVKRLAGCEKDYEAIRNAMLDVDEAGYGIVAPTDPEIALMEPEIIKKGSNFSVKLKASAPSYHIVRVDVETEMTPAFLEGQSEDVAKYLVNEYESDKSKLWEAGMFGKPLSTLIKEDLSAKIDNMPKDARQKMKRTVTRIVNEGRGGVLCILL